jgi:hypothetical protein
VLLTCASPSAVCLTTGVLVFAAGESRWVACLITGVTVLVTGASACPADGTADAVVFCVVAELPLPPEEWLPVPEGWVPAGDCPVLVLEWPVPDELLPVADEPGPDDPVPEEPVLDALPCRTEFTAEVADVTGFVAALTADPADERADDGADPRDDRVSRVDACACLENSIMMTKIPAATIASCIARRATRRAIGCGMSTPLARNRRMLARCCPFFAGLCHAPAADLHPKAMTCCAATNVQRFRLVRQEVWEKLRAR